MLGSQEWQSDFCARLVDKYAHSFRDTIAANRILRDLRAPISDVDGGQADIFSEEIESFKRDLHREKKRIRFFAQIVREFTPGEFADRCFLSLQNITASLAEIEQCGDFPSIAKIVADEVIAVLDELEDAAHQYSAKSPAASPENDEQDSFEGESQLSREATPNTSEGAFDDGDGAGKAQDVTTIRILLLSDLHLGMEDSDWLWPSLKDVFGDDLLKECNEYGPIDLVFFLGDMVFSGARNEYVKLQPQLNTLWKNETRRMRAPLASNSRQS